MAGLFTDPGCTPSHGVTAGQALSLTTPVQEAGVTVFRATLYMCIPVDGRCKGVRLAPASQLSVRFEPVTVHVEPGDDAWIDDWSSETDAATVRMRYPAPVSKVYSSTYRKAQFYRLDGEAVSEQATVSADVGQPLPDPFVGAEFRVQLSEVVEEIVALRMAEAVNEMHQPMVTFMSLAAGAGSGATSSQHGVASEAAMRRVLALEALKAIDLRGLPGTPRLRLMNETQAETLWQWLEPGEHSTAVTFGASGDDLAKLLQPALDRAFAQRVEANENAVESGGDPDHSPIVLPLEIESDAPCRVVVEPADLLFLLETELLTEPVTLRFASGADRTEHVALDPPSGTAVQLHVDATVAQRETAPLQEPPPISPSVRQGIQLESGSHAAVPWQADRPCWLCGLAFGWYALSERTVLSAAIFPDAAGQPTAQPLAESRIDVVVSDPGWVRGRWPDVPVQPGAYWLRLRADEGFGVWLGTPGAARRTVWLQSPPVRGVTTTLALDPMVVPLEGRGAAAEPAPPIAVSLNGAGLTLSAGRAGAVSADLADMTALAAPEPWSLDVASAHELTVTLQSARLVYQL